ncbi:MAG: hypothetical protein E6J40_09090 [Chloroflexi bacterium]|nr:MAG: hypothetical protein E6J40_09090 [Chloroflexota bacterium]
MKSRFRTEPDLQSQLESLLDQVWRSEADWRFMDRVDALVLMESLRAKRAARIAQDAARQANASPDQSSENAA